MTQAELTGSDWGDTLARLGGVQTLEQEARSTRAFLRPREVKCGVDLLRLILAYCPSAGSVSIRWTGCPGMIVEIACL